MNNGGGVVDVSSEGRGVLSGVEVVGSSSDVLEDSGEGAGHEGEESENGDL